MKRFLYLAIFAVFINGCSSEPAGNVARTNANVDELNHPSQNPYPNSNATGLEPQFVSVNNDNKLLVKGANTGKVEPIAPNAKPNAYSAPDDSEIVSAMNKQGQMMETRTFRNNPTIAKVERVYIELDKPVVKVYLKDGKTVDITTVKIDNPMKASAADIINAVNAGK